MPSVQFQAGPPSGSIIYMRGASDGGNGNHSGPEPSVGTYLDEQPITTIGGTLDVHVYDIARVEVLPGPQGTLYGSSSESGTLRIITNKPSTSGFSGALDLPARAMSPRASSTFRLHRGLRSAWSLSTNTTRDTSTTCPARAPSTTMRGPRFPPRS